MILIGSQGLVTMESAIDYPDKVAHAYGIEEAKIRQVIRRDTGSSRGGSARIAIDEAARGEALYVIVECRAGRYVLEGLA